MLTSTALVSLGVLSYSATGNFTAAATVADVPDTGGAQLILSTSPGSNNAVHMHAPAYYSSEIGQRRIELTPARGATLEAVLLTTSTADSKSAVTPGLQLWIARCSRAWVRTQIDPRRYVCPANAKQADVLGSRGEPVPLAQTNTPLARLSSGRANYLRAQVSVVAGAPGSDSNSDITFSFAALGSSGAGR